MNAADIRTVNERCQAFTAKSTISREQQNVGLKSVEVSMLTEIAAQLAEANEHLVKITSPPLVFNAEGLDLNMEAMGHPSAKITFMPERPTLRDQFAMAALTGILANAERTGSMVESTEGAYAFADAMLKARK